MFLFHEFLGGCVGLKKIIGRAKSKYLRGVKPNDYSIMVLDRGGSSQMITVLRFLIEGGQAK